MSCNLSLYRLNAALAYNHKLPKFISAQLNRDYIFTFEVHISLGAQIPKILKLSFRIHNNHFNGLGPPPQGSGGWSWDYWTEPFWPRFEGGEVEGYALG